jgi:hypothetical protein
VAELVCDSAYQYRQTPMTTLQLLVAAALVATNGFFVVADWHIWGDHLPLEIVISPYRATVAPLARYIQAIHQQRPELVLTVFVPETVDRHWRHQLLHNRIAVRLRRVLRTQPKTVIAEVPFHLTH